ncbi:hypothetical protein M899_2770 [Bacteriovorax sp. BSW11_IV]|uniref:protein-glutamine glutaminase family protein n=1 Tax=Bacteriovorax sp. BSW11_IV TaxID=1353529 RepID=UPI00038A52B5|nr:protein-glutamine glutaminase family protein [Bacteriovorax sp. BSW11_IV]EQC48852.1 hypothetical protein M899_2770 [Bacteriovorax sp. BSW11_IV]
MREQTTKLFLFLFLFSTITVAHASSITLQDGKKLNNCEAHKESSTLFCKDGKDEVMVLGNMFGFTAVALKGKSVTQLNVSEVVIGDETVFKTSFEPTNTTFETPNWKKSISYNANGITSIIMSIENSAMGVENFPADIQEKRDAFIKKLETLQEEYGKELNTNSLKVSLESGKVLNCERIKTTYSHLAADQKEFYQGPGSHLKCPIFKCKSPGKEDFYTLMDNQPGSFADVINFNNGEYKNDQNISFIQSNIPGLFLHDTRGPKVQNPFENFNEKSQLSKDSFIPAQMKRYSAHLKKASTPHYSTMIAYATTICNPSDVKIFKNAEEKFSEQLSNAKVAEYVTFMNDGLFNFYINGDAVPEIACFQNGTYYNPEAYRKLKERGAFIAEQQKTISEDDVNRLFNKAIKMDNIAWNFKADGCYARAHLMAREFEKEGIYVEKAWAKGSLGVTTPDGEINWNFHVAPSLNVKMKDGTIKKMVIDPSVSDKPTTADEWAEKISKLRVQKTGFPYPVNSVNLNRTSLAFSSTDEYMPSEFQSTLRTFETEEKRMEHANSTMLEYKGYGK